MGAAGIGGDRVADRNHVVKDAGGLVGDFQRVAHEPGFLAGGRGVLVRHLAALVGGDGELVEGGLAVGPEAVGERRIERENGGVDVELDRVVFAFETVGGLEAFRRGGGRGFGAGGFGHRVYGGGFGRLRRAGGKQQRGEGNRGEKADHGAGTF